ncbi:MAG: hypothetical protein WC054_04220 [Candidatus Nanopelagicales bacterium]
MTNEDTAPIPSAEPSAAELAELRAEIKFLREQVAVQEMATRAAPVKERGTWWRTALSTFLIIVACLMAPLSVFSVWAKGEITDTSRYVATVAPLASNPEVQEAVTTRITQEIFKYIDVDSLTTELVSSIASNRNLTPTQQAALQALTGPVTSGIESFTESTINKVVTSQAFADAWTQANYIAHNQIVALLSGDDTGAISVDNDEVKLDLGDVITQVKNQLVAQGFTIAEKIPAIDAQIVLFQSDQIGRLQMAYSALDAMGFWLPIAVIVVGLLGVLAAKSRRRAIVGFGVGLFISMAIIAFGLTIGRAVYLSNLPPTVDRDAATAVYDAFALFLQSGIQAGAVMGIVLALGGLLTGPSRLAVAIRGLAVKGAQICQHGLERVGASLASAREFVAAQATAIRIVLTVLAAGFVLIQQYKTPSLIIWATVFLLIALFVVQIFASGIDDDGKAIKPISDSPNPADSPDGTDSPGSADPVASNEARKQPTPVG